MKNLQPALLGLDVGPGMQLGELALVFFSLFNPNFGPGRMLVLGASF